MAREGLNAVTHPKCSPEHPAARTDPRRTFDGIVCFGDSDWWYHNRGHYDMQMMREFSRLVPVLYINSTGLRMPRIGEGGMFLQRIARKLQSLRRGLVTVRRNFSVYSPLVVPGPVGMAASRHFLLPQVRWAMRKLRIRRPLLWVVCPPAAEIVDRLTPAAVVYQRTDVYEKYPGVDAERVRRFDRFLKARADLTLFCSTYLLDREAGDCRRALFADHGVDYERFAAAGRRSAETDAQAHQGNGRSRAPGRSEALRRLQSIARPRIGFVGSIDAHTFDPPLFLETVRLLPQANFVLVGGCSLPPNWCCEPNVTFLGRQPYEDVADLMAACDVLIMPWNRSEWIRACNPVKLKEYLAVGRPVVSSPFEELSRYNGHVLVAEDSCTFAQRIQQALASPPDPEVLRRRVCQETWTAKAALVLDELTRSAVVRREGPLDPVQMLLPDAPNRRKLRWSCALSSENTI